MGVIGKLIQNMTIFPKIRCTLLGLLVIGDGVVIRDFQGGCQ